MHEVSDSRPLLAITMGDPAGIGPEIVLKALRHREVFAAARPLVIGDRRILRRAAEWVGQPEVEIEAVRSPEEARFAPGVVAVLDLDNAVPGECPPGEVSAAAGRAAVEYVLAAADLALAGRVDAMVTAPLNKAAMNAAGFHFAGHTELLAERTGTPNVKMLLVGPKLRVIHVSTHVALTEAIRRITTANVLAAIELGQESMQALGIARPRIAVAG
ncbi:MAG TPA: 4-hydroxythreonine-4-phosphate dehydrogenase PdxA, partial [Thermomicrobiaceae bacterium]|nr:4-hydroxythreonine-4-phosphate dehydrogenase PdxA [Thermomicrobiaceae bacterium]